MTTAWNLLTALRLTRIIQSLQDVRDLPQQLVFSSRIPTVDAEDSEIMARFTGYATIADIIADDQRAVTYQNTKLSYETTKIPNIKHGTPITQTMLNQLQALMNGMSVQGENVFDNYQRRTIDGLLLGVRQRREALLVAMALDDLDYDRFGIKLTNISWGMPSDLKVTPSTAWDNAGSATPVADILAVVLLGKVRYGITYDRITMSTTAFRYMIATTEFQNKAKLFIPVGFTFTNLNLADLKTMTALAEQTLGMTIELYDGRYWEQSEAGALESAPFLPVVKVILSSKSDDNDASAWDFANGTTTESIVSSLAPTQIAGSFGGPTRGPIAYATVVPDLNPPNITYWAVMRGFPRKHRLQSTAVLTVGTFQDSIPVGPPF